MDSLRTGRAGLSRYSPGISNAAPGSATRLPGSSCRPAMPVPPAGCSRSWRIAPGTLPVDLDPSQPPGKGCRPRSCLCRLRGIALRFPVSAERPAVRIRSAIRPHCPSCRFWWRYWQRETTFGVGCAGASGEAFLSSKQSNTSASVVAWRRRETDSASPIGDPF